MWPENSWECVSGDFSKGEIVLWTMEHILDFKGEGGGGGEEGIFLRTYTLDDRLETLAVPLFIGMCDGTDLVVISRAEDAAEQQLVGPHSPLRRLVDLHHLLVNLLRHDGCRVLSPRCTKNHHEVPLRLHAQVTLDIVFQTPREHAVVGTLDGLDICIRPREEHVIEQLLVRSRPVKRFP